MGEKFVGIKRERKKSIHDAYLKDGSTCVKEFGMTILDQKVNLILNPYDPTKSFLWSSKKILPRELKLRLFLLVTNLIKSFFKKTFYILKS